MREWGPKGPGEHGDIRPPKESWFERWSIDIQRYILDMTSLRGKKTPIFETTPKNAGIRVQLTKKGLKDAKIFFVVESVDPQVLASKKTGVEVVHRLNYFGVGAGLAQFKDYCWFTSSPQGGDYFRCSKEQTIYAMGNTRIKQKDNLRRIHIVDVLNYCSSAWATEKGQVNKHKHTTKELRIYEGGTKIKKRFRLVDAGGTFNDPLIPYFVYARYKKSTGFMIWNFDFSGYTKSDKMGNLEQMSKLKAALKRIDKPLAKDALKKIIGQTKGVRQRYSFEIKNRLIKHCPLYGEHSKEQLVTTFPTRRTAKFWGVKKWSMMMVEYFKSEWGGHLKQLLQDF
eukprot:375643_1